MGKLPAWPLKQNNMNAYHVLSECGKSSKCLFPTGLHWPKEMSDPLPWEVTLNPGTALLAVSVYLGLWAMPGSRCQHYDLWGVWGCEGRLGNCGIS